MKIERFCHRRFLVEDPETFESVDCVAVAEKHEIPEDKPGDRFKTIQAKISIGTQVAGFFCYLSDGRHKMIPQGELDAADKVIEVMEIYKARITKAMDEFKLVD